MAIDWLPPVLSQHHLAVFLHLWIWPRKVSVSVSIRRTSWTSQFLHFFIQKNAGSCDRIWWNAIQNTLSLHDTNGHKMAQGFFVLLAVTCSFFEMIVIDCHWCPYKLPSIYRKSMPVGHFVASRAWLKALSGRTFADDRLFCGEIGRKTSSIWERYIDIKNLST